MHSVIFDLVYLCLTKYIQVLKFQFSVGLIRMFMNKQFTKERQCTWPHNIYV